MKTNILFPVLVLACTSSAGMEPDDAGSTSDVLAADTSGASSPDVQVNGGSAPVATCTPSGLAEADLERKTTGGAVTVDATFLNGLQHCTKTELVFKLVMDTHSVDLTAIDIAAAARVTTNMGDTRADGFTWKPGAESSHHRDGLLTAPSPNLSGARWLRLSLGAVAGTERVFEWNADVLVHELR